VSGLHQRGGSQIYVSSGTGYWGPPMRIAAPAEITLIELGATEANEARARG
jgi:predicted MPP superfamily phosphohydrolase